MIDKAKTFAYGTLVVIIDALAAPLFWLIHRKPKGYYDDKY